MKLLHISVLLFTGSISAFVPINSPRTFTGSQRGNVARFMSQDPLPFFAVTEETTSEEKDVNEMTLDEEVDALVQEEIKKTRKISNLRNEKGVDYAPWMKISEEDEEKIRAVMRERAEARRKRQEQEKDVSGNLYFDSQAQELSGTGLNFKIIDGEVELEWATREERDTKGFIVKRRPAKTSEFEVLATYEQWGPLVSKGKEGGIYRYLDGTVSPGGWVYRITECDNNGVENDVCQCLVEVQTEEEQRAALIAGVGIAVLGVAAIAAGILLDPLNGY